MLLSCARDHIRRMGRACAGRPTHIDIADRRPLTEVAAVHADADGGRLPGKTILYTVDQ
jgi:hypothetical protein